MQEHQHLLRLLGRDGYQSGTALGEALGISRMAVQKRIQSLIELGLPIQAVSGKGYLLEEGIRLLDSEQIMAEIDPQLASRLAEVDVLTEIESTNSYLLSQPIPIGQARACLAECQTAGRGRRGNDWQSAPFRNLMLSLSWGFPHWPATITGLGLAVALVVAEYANLQLNTEVKIKWPNDVLVDDAKLGGILLDVAGESSGECHVVIGVGLNVDQPDWSQSDDYQWQDLKSLGIQTNRNALAAGLINGLVQMLLEFEREGFGAMRARWNALSSYADREIRVTQRSTVVEGRMIGVDDSGALLVKSGDGVTHAINDSVASVRLL